MIIIAIINILGKLLPEMGQVIRVPIFIPWHSKIHCKNNCTSTVKY